MVYIQELVTKVSYPNFSGHRKVLLFALVGSNWNPEKSLLVFDDFSLFSVPESTGRLLEALALLSFDFRFSDADSPLATRPHSNETVKKVGRSIGLDF